MIRGRRPLLVLCSPLLVTIIATVVMVTVRRRELSQERTQPGLGIRSPEIRHVSAETKKQDSWRLSRRMVGGQGPLVDRAAELALEARIDPEARELALQRLQSLCEELPSDAPEALQVLHLLGKTQGMWGAGDLEASLDTLRGVLGRGPDKELRAQIHYEIGLTLERGLNDLDGALREYRRAVQAEPGGLHGLLAAGRLSLEEDN